MSMDDEVLCQRVDHQLYKIESVHTLARAIFYGNNGEIQYINLEEILRYQPSLDIDEQPDL